MQAHNDLTLNPQKKAELAKLRDLIIAREAFLTTMQRGLGYSQAIYYQFRTLLITDFTEFARQELLISASIMLPASFLVLIYWNIRSQQALTLQEIDSRMLAPNIPITKLIKKHGVVALAKMETVTAAIHRLFNHAPLLNTLDDIRHSAHLGYANRAFEASLTSAVMTDSITLMEPDATAIKDYLQLAINVLVGGFNCANYQRKRRVFHLLRKEIESQINEQQICQLVNRFNWQRLNKMRMLFSALIYAIYGATLAITSLLPLLRLFVFPNTIQVLGITTMVLGALVSAIQGWRNELLQQLKYWVLVDYHNMQNPQVNALPSGNWKSQISFNLFLEGLWALYTAGSISDWLSASEVPHYEKVEKLCVMGTIIAAIYLLVFIEQLTLLPRQANIKAMTDAIINEPIAVAAPNPIAKAYRWCSNRISYCKLKKRRSSEARIMISDEQQPGFTSLTSPVSPEEVADTPTV